MRFLGKAAPVSSTAVLDGTERVLPRSLTAAFVVGASVGLLGGLIGVRGCRVPASGAALNAGLSAVTPEQSGLASGLLGTSYQGGSAIGLAVMTSIATSYGADQLGNVAELTNGYQAAFIGAAGVAVAAALAALTLLRTESGAAAEPAQTPEEVEIEETIAA